MDGRVESGQDHGYGSSFWCDRSGAEAAMINNIEIEASSAPPSRRGENLAG
jgi:hypothetical protein